MPGLFVKASFVDSACYGVDFVHPIIDTKFKLNQSWIPIYLACFLQGQSFYTMHNEKNKKKLVWLLCENRIQENIHFANVQKQTVKRICYFILLYFKIGTMCYWRCEVVRFCVWWLMVRGHYLGHPITAVHKRRYRISENDKNTAIPLFSQCVAECLKSLFHRIFLLHVFFSTLPFS